MKFGLMLPNKGRLYGDAQRLLDLAILAEESGWEGFFIWDHIGGAKNSPTVDPWVILGAIASHTHRVRLGTMITPLSRRRPWKVAREIVTLDHLSHGRANLGVGLGDFINKDFKAFGEVSNARTRAEMLDEGLNIIKGLQSGTSFSFSGRHYQVAEECFKPLPIQTPHVPVWVAAHWPFKRPLRRAAHWDGVLPRQWSAGPITPAVIQEISSYIKEHRELDTPFDIIKYGLTKGKNLTEDLNLVKAYGKAGATWWIEEIFPSRGSLKQIQERIIIGPPR